MEGMLAAMAAKFGELQSLLGGFALIGEIPFELANRTLQFNAPLGLGGHSVCLNVNLA